MGCIRNPPYFFANCVRNLSCYLGAHDEAVDAAEAVLVDLIAAHHIEILATVVDGPLDQIRQQHPTGGEFIEFVVDP